MYPEWVEKQHKKGTSIKVINGNYYLYKVTSKRVKEKPYPVSIQQYLGRITKKGLIRPTKISFMPGIDEISYLGMEEDIKGKDKEELNKIPAIKQGEIYYVGKINSKEKEIIEKYYHHEKGKIWR